MLKAPLLRDAVIPFMRWRHATEVALVVVLVCSASLLYLRGLELGLDFSGGAQMELRFAADVDPEILREALDDLQVRKARVMHFGSRRDVLVRVGELSTGEAKILVEKLLQRIDTEAEIRRLEFIGAQVGEELRDKGGLALLGALLLVMGYLALRFQYKFSIAAIGALLHDVLLVLGLFSLFSWQFDLSVLAALLAVIGYSLNDTIVVSDRIRENFRRIAKGDPENIINLSLTQTLARTLVTSLTTLLVLLALYFLGGEALRGFSRALLVGVIAGTYSSIYVASPLLLRLRLSRADMLLPERTQNEKGVL